MAWDEDLFAVLDDLEQQAEALYDAERDAELADRSRAEYGAVTLASRLMASLGASCRGGSRVSGRLTGALHRVVEGLVLVTGRPAMGRALPAVSSVDGVSARSVPGGRVVTDHPARAGVGAAPAAPTRGAVRASTSPTGRSTSARVRRVGADFVEVAVGGGRVELVPHAALAAIRSRP